MVQPSLAVFKAIVQLLVAVNIQSGYMLNCHERDRLFLFSSSLGQTQYESHRERMRGRRGEREKTRQARDVVEVFSYFQRENKENKSEERQK